MLRWAVLVVRYGGHDTDADVAGLFATEEEAEEDARRVLTDEDPDDLGHVAVFVAPTPAVVRVRP